MKDVSTYAWSRSDWLTLQLAPAWVVTAVTGRSRFDEPEEVAFWRSLAESEPQSPLSWRLRQEMELDGDWLLREIAVDDRSIAAGLTQAASLLEERVSGDVSRETRQWMVSLGTRFARARGPFGLSISSQDLRTLQLVTQLLETVTETVENNPLDAATSMRS